MTLVAAPDLLVDAEAAARRGAVLARATCISRDLANCPPAHLTAERMGQVALRLGAETALVVETFDREQLLELRCGGILGVNGGSHDEPRMIKLSYSPDSPTGSMAWVGKGIMYDSGGISLKPADGTHAMMKNDMAGAGALLAAMLTLGDLGCRTSVTGYLMCTDNMPSGSALKMGDVITARNGTTVEVANTDAEGRVVMMDALLMAAEQKPDAIIDIATLTGASMRALGTLVAGVMGNTTNESSTRSSTPPAPRTSSPGSCPRSVPTGNFSTATSPTSPTSAEPASSRGRSPPLCSSRNSLTTPRGPTSTSPALSRPIPQAAGDRAGAPASAPGCSPN